MLGPGVLACKTVSDQTVPCSARVAQSLPCGQSKENCLSTVPEGVRGLSHVPETQVPGPGIARLLATGGAGSLTGLATSL